MRFSAGFLVAVLVAAAVATDLEVRAGVDRSEIYIGDRLTYQIRAIIPEKAIAEAPGLIGNLGAFEVKDYQVSHRPPENGRAEYSWTLVLSTFVGGTFVLPPQEILAIQGTDTTRLYTEPVPVRVLSRVDSLADEDISEVESVMHDGAWPTWAKIALGLAVAGALGLGIWLARRYWKKRAAVAELPPYEEAVLALQGLRARNWLSQGMQAEHFFALGQILRRYLQRRFAVDVMDATTAELEERLRQIAGLTEALREGFAEFSRETDLVKFARQPIPEDRAEALDRFADRLLQETRPLPGESEQRNTAGGGA